MSQSITYNGGGEKIIYQGKVHTLDKSANDIIKKGSALVISGDIVKRASNLPLKIAVEIRCLKQEAMNNDYQDESGLFDSYDVTKKMTENAFNLILNELKNKVSKPAQRMPRQ